MILIIKASSKGLWEHNEVIHEMKPQLLQEALHSPERSMQKVCRATVAGLAQPQDQCWFTGAAAVAKAAGTEERSLNLNRLWERAGTFTMAMKTWLSL